MSKKKLLLRDRVEVRQFEEGLRGSWHPGVVVGTANLNRSVKYDELLSATGKSKLIEFIPVSKAVEGICDRRRIPATYRGRIRPPPPFLPTNYCKPRMLYGLCVDAFYEDAWWEGVLFDHKENCKERSVFFPDEGDEWKFNVNDLRISRVWNEQLDDWTERGSWVLVGLVEELKQDRLSPSFIKKVWSHMQLNSGFLKMISEWTCGDRNSWSKYLAEVIIDIAVQSSKNDVSISEIRERESSRNIDNQENGCSFKYENRPNKEEKSGVSVLPQTSIGEGIHDNCPTDCSSQGDVNISTVPLPIQKKGPLILRFKLKKPNSGVHIEGKPGEIPANEKEQCFLSKEKKCAVKNKLTKKLLKSLVMTRAKKEASLFDSSRRGNEMPPDVPLNKNIKRRSNIKRKRKLTSDVPIRKNKKETTPAILVTDNIQRKNFATRSQTEKSIIGKVQISSPRKAMGKASCILTNRRNFKVRAGKAKRRLRKKGVGLKSKVERDEMVHDTLSKDVKNLDFSRRGSLLFAKFDGTFNLKDMVSRPKKRRKGTKLPGRLQSDTICLICQFGGKVVLCDHCSSAYHLSCIDLKEIPEGNWYCPSCQCGVCGISDRFIDVRPFTTACYQCSRQYHVECLAKQGLQMLGSCLSKKFCSEKCVEIFQHFHQLCGKSNPTEVEGFSWKLLRRGRNYCSIHDMTIVSLKEVDNALKVMHECFEPATEPHTNRDLVADILYNRTSMLRRLDFHGFYTIVLQKGDDYVCVATLRVLGQKVAEMPLIATCFGHRRQGMCRILVNELEKMLIQLGVERLVLPAIPQLSETWKTCFGFIEMSLQERLHLLEYPLLVFQGTSMYHKFLTRPAQSEGDESNRVSDISDNHNPVVPQINLEHKIAGSCRRFSGLHYLRSKRKSIDRKSSMVQCCPGRTDAYKFVYKRRRVQATRD